MHHSLRTWAASRRRKLISTRFLIFIFVGGLLIFSPYWSHNLFGGITPANLIKLLATKFSAWGFLFDQSWFSEWSKNNDRLATTVLVGVFSALLATICPLNRFHDTFLSSFNHDVLTPIDRLHIDRDMSEEWFVQLEWVLGPEGPRRAAWDALDGWCRSRSAVPVEPGSSPISVAILVGRSGSGKSRMAHRFARTLARRDRLGGSATKGALTWRIGVYIRRVAPFMRSRRDDPWDAGLLDRRDRDSGFDEVCARLRLWAPRLPTILLLDDPLPGWSRMVREALGAANTTNPFKHVVCVLIVNQTVPADTHVEFDLATRQWFYDARVMTPQPILLPIAAWFTPEEAVKAAFTSGHLLGRSLDIERHVREHLYDVTKGNPLLVVLAIEWIRNGHPIVEMTADNLTRNRARRILTGLRHRGITADVQLAALALATLVGSASRDRIHAAAERILGEHLHLPPTKDLQACFPTEPLAVGSATRIPAVRPDLVADAFVDCVLEEIGTDRASALAEEAFRLDPGAMLRGMRRIHPRGSPMTRALSLVDPARVPGLDPVDLALALADVAVICRIHDRPLSTAESRADAVDRAAAAVDRLTRDQREALCLGFAALFDIRADQRDEQRIRPIEAMRLVCCAADGEAGAVSLDAIGSCFAGLKHLASDSNSVGSFDRLQKAARDVRSFDVAERAAQAAWGMGHVWRLELRPFWQAVGEACSDMGLPVQSFRFQAAAGLSDPETARVAADAAADFAERFPDDHTIQREAATARRYEAYAWCLVPAGAQALAARAAADVVRDIAARFPDDPAIQREAIVARRCEAHAWCLVRAGAQALASRVAADAVRDIAARFPGDPAIQWEAATARKNEAYAWSQVPAGAQELAARAAADIVRDIAARFPDDPAIQREAAEARKYEAYAWSQVPAGAQALAARAAADIIRGIVARFPDDPVIQREAAEARRHDAYAWGAVPAGAQALSVRAAADVVRDIAARFPDDPAIQLAAVEARLCEVNAWSKVPAGAQASAARSGADVVRDIAARFPDDPAIQLAAVEARSCEVNAWSNVPAGAQALVARCGADVVRDIAARFPDNPAIQLVAVETRSFEVYGWCQVPAGAQALAARAAAEAADDIALRFPDDAAIQCKAAEARRNEAYAWSQVQSGAQALAARAVAEDMAVRSPDDVAIQRQAAGARSCEVYAWSQVPAGEQAPAARVAAEAACDIALRFPDDAAIQREAAVARRNEAYAWSQVPAGAQAPAARVAAEAACDIALRFPDDAAIQREAAVARRNEAYAWSQVPAGAQAPATRVAAEAAGNIASQFPDDPTIQNVAAAARDIVGRLRRS